MSPTQWIGLKIQCRVKITFTSRHIGTRILWWLSIHIKKIRVMTDFSDQFRKMIMCYKRTQIIKCYKRIGYNLNVMWQSACLVINPITIVGFAELFNCTPVNRAPWWLRPKANHFSWLGPELSSVARSTGAQLIIFFCFRFPVLLFNRAGISICHATRCICWALVFASS